MKVAVVISTLNRSRLLKQTLESLLQQEGISGPDCEVTVIDNGSTDDTKAVVEGAFGKSEKFRYINEGSPGLHMGRNLGWRNTDAEIVAYLDDDVLLSPGWLAGIRSAFLEPEVVLAGGPILPAFEAAIPDWLDKMWKGQPAGNRVLGELSILDLGEKRKDISPYHVFGCNFLIRRRVLVAANGFHPDGMPAKLLKFRGDGETSISDFIKRNQWRTLYEPQVAIQHHVSKERATLSYFDRRWFAQGISDSYTEVRSRLGLSSEIRSKLKVASRFFSSQFGFSSGGTLTRRFKRSWLRGYLFHQWNVVNNQATRAWVLQEHYLGSSGTVPTLQR
jgi:glycosyltransferase involved in cell wall biosynthesis